MKPSLKIMVGPVPAVALNRNMLFCSRHVASTFTTATVTNADGTQYIPPGSAWVRIATAAGDIEERADHFNFQRKPEFGDGLYPQTWRALPDAAIESRVARVAVNDLVSIDARARGVTINARVKRVEGAQVFLDYIPQSNDSGSLVRTLDGDFVAVLTGADVGNSGAWVGSYATAPDASISDPTLTHVPGTGNQGETAIPAPPGSSVTPRPPTPPPAVVTPPAPQPAPATPAPAVETITPVSIAIVAKSSAGGYVFLHLDGSWKPVPQTP